MRAGACYLLGEHDFATFGSAPDKRGHTVRIVQEVKWSAEGRLLVFAIEANAFLYHMVRSIVGTLRMVGSGERKAEMMAEVLAAGDRARCGTLAPPQGLTLVEVKY
jgi:tRNA pseudouridine38-40 synthase